MILAAGFKWFSSCITIKTVVLLDITVWLPKVSVRIDVSENYGVYLPHDPVF